MDDLDHKDIFLRKDGLIIGLHTIGHAETYIYRQINVDKSEELITTDFMSLESWGNEYNDNFEMIGRGSFRLGHFDIEEEAKLFELEGWVRFER